MRWPHTMLKVEFDVVAPKPYRIRRNNGHYTVQGHSMLPFSVPVESPCATSCLWIIVSYILSGTVSALVRDDPRKTIAILGLEKLETSHSLCHMAQKYCEQFRRGSRVWQTDGRTDGQIDFTLANAVLHYCVANRNNV